MEKEQFAISDTLTHLWEKLEHWVEMIILNLPNFILALLVFLLFTLLSKYAYRLCKQLLHRKNIQKSIQTTLALLIRIVIISIGLFIALGVMNLDRALASVLAGAGIASFAIGFALQGALKNIISGFILSFMSQINIKDWIKTKEYEGEVFKINLRNIVLKQSDNNIVVIPNTQIVESPFKNFSLTSRSRIVVESRIAFHTDLSLAEEIIKQAISKNFPQQNQEKIDFFYDEFEDHAITFIVRFWTDVQKRFDIRTARHEAIRIIKTAFDQNDIIIPYPKQSIGIAKNTEENQGYF